MTIGGIDFTGRQFRERRRRAYRDVLADLPDEAASAWQVKLLAGLASVILPRRLNYSMAFRGVIGRQVLADLNKFCYAARSTLAPDAHTTMRNEGRRQVWLRLQWYLHVDEREVSELNEEET
jgi:hypothetical protein